MDISSVFYKDEVRCGFYIPTAIKQFWGATLMVLEEIDRICQKHHIEYFADWGTLIGTVRHGGFVPWDDDLDICMKREDYIRFRQVADSELPPEYCIHDYERQEDHWLFLARVCNSRHISFDKAHLDKYHNFPYIGAIDIFIQDYMYRDPKKEKERCDSIKYLLALAEAIRDESIRYETLMSNLADIKNRYGVNISPKQSPRDISIDIYKLIERRMSEVKEEDSDRLVQIFPWGLKGAKGLPKAYYEQTVRLPFECTTMPVPQCYNRVLRDRYGDFLKVHKVWSGHNYPAFEGQRANLQAVADFELPEFKFDPSMLEHVKMPGDNSVKSVAESFIGQLEELNQQIGSLINCLSNNGGSVELVLDTLAQCQQLAVDFGGFLEDVKGEDTLSVKSVIFELEEYCDKAYILYNAISQCNDQNIKSDQSDAVFNIGMCLDSLKGSIKQHVYDRDNVLFVADGIGRLSELVPFISQESLNEDNDVYVTVVPSFFKDVYGNILATDDEIDTSIEQTADVCEFLKGLTEESDNIYTISWDKVDFEALRPKKVYYQNPYDAENPCLTVPTHLYASNMKLYTDQLIYVAPVTDEFRQEDTTDVYNMKHYVTAPGVIMADIVYVHSDNMRDMYIWKLTEFTGEKTRTVWEDKIEVKTYADYDKKTSEHVRKRLLYVIGLNEQYEHEAESLERALTERRKLFEKYKENMDVTICDYPDESHIEVNDYDAYYGSPSPFVLEFTRAGKPVMIADFEL